MKLRVNEIFQSIQGEGIQIGAPTIFLRLFGCDLRCAWCDSMHAVEGGDYQNITLDDIIQEAESHDCKNICITGGEPLLQQDVLVPLIDILIQKKYNILLETSGHIRPNEIFYNPNVLISMDCKCPGSTMEKKTDFSILESLQEKDQIKFVINDKSDYEYAKQIITHRHFRATIVFQPVYGTDISFLVDLALKDNLNIKVLPQLHKLIWGDIRGV
jgi:7-carboxy-7-deazaguanine synthase|tara:strand:- start:287 stop:931 length:645 start_codon:yes stop_codon:yes gene_type:complete